ncbi:MAG: Substrate-specific component PdxU2 of predicted pyridoxin-related ECF transporter [Firmicutes bacterium]|nr:Substrate-specific component PdxU2 of predicted pyridoxin-related ECF transporter [Bacillota bacterium]MDI6706887.1 ECF transporter S component [Bacillota bacterium]
MSNTQKLVIAALLTALVTVATMAFQVPIPATKGYINLGDTVIFIAALLLGPKYGALAGGVGSALADLLSPYAAWAPFTLVIKGIEGFIVGYILYKAFSGESNLKSRVAAMALGGLWMVVGYFAAEVLLYGTPAAIVELPGNLVQASGSALIALPVVAVMSRINVFKSVN